MAKLNDAAELAAQISRLSVAVGSLRHGPSLHTLTMIPSVVADFRNLKNTFLQVGKGKQPDPKESKGEQHDLGKSIGDAVAEAVRRVLAVNMPKPPGQSSKTGEQQKTGPKPPEPGKQRFYHGGNYPGEAGEQQARTGSKWVTASEDYAKRMTSGGKKDLFYTDIDERDPVLKGKSQTTGGPASYRNFELPANYAKNFKRFAGGESGAGAAVNGARTAAGAAEAGGAAAGEAAGAGAAGGGGAGAGLGAVAAPVAALTGFTLVVNELRRVGMEWAKEQEEYARQLGEVNPIIANQIHQLDMNRMIRDIESGNNLSESNQKLLDEVDALEEELRPIKDMLSEIKNIFAADVIQFTREIVDVGKSQYEIMRSIYEFIRTWTPAGLILPKAPELESKSHAPGQGFGAFLQQVREDGEREKREAEERIQKIREVMRKRK